MIVMSSSSAVYWTCDDGTVIIPSCTDQPKSCEVVPGCTIEVFFAEVDCENPHATCLGE